MNKRLRLNISINTVCVALSCAVIIGTIVGVEAGKKRRVGAGPYFERRRDKQTKLKALVSNNGQTTLQDDCHGKNGIAQPAQQQLKRNRVAEQHSYLINDDDRKEVNAALQGIIPSARGVADFLAPATLRSVHTKIIAIFLLARNGRCTYIELATIFRFCNELIDRVARIQDRGVKQQELTQLLVSTQDSVRRLRDTVAQILP